MTDPKNKQDPGERHILNGAFSVLPNRGFPLPVEKTFTVYSQNTDLKDIASQLEDKEFLCIDTLSHPLLCGRIDQGALQYLLDEHDRHDEIAGITSHLVLETDMNAMNNSNPYKA